MQRWAGLAVLTMSLCGSAALAAPHEQRIALSGGRLAIHDLNAALCHDMELPLCPDRHVIDLRGAEGDEFLLAINSCLGADCELLRGADGLILRTDPAQMPRGCDAVRRMARIYVAERAPQATAAQARNWGLQAPASLDPSKPMVVVIHGLDADRGECYPMAQLLAQRGHQVACFGYPGDQPIHDSADLLARSLAQLHARAAGLRIDIVAHSMGALVARDYIEGPRYGGYVDHLILIAPPNGGSKWARLRTLLSIQQNYRLRRDNPDWRWSWLVTEGMGEAGGELLPDSAFLKQLNARPRRAAVHYTIVAGNKSSIDEVEAGVVYRVSDWIPQRTRNWWGFGYCFRKLRKSAELLNSQAADNDGPVTLSSAHLSGVSDFTVLPADHVALFLPVNGGLPAAWPIVEDRLTKK